MDSVLAGLSNACTDTFTEDLTFKFGKYRQKPAIARPLAVVRSRASVSDTNATPNSFSSFSETARSGTDRPSDPVTTPE